MRDEPVEFFSEGVRLHGKLRYPDGPDHAPWPVVLHPPGWLGVADGPHYVRWHEGLTAGGYAVFVFDYRGFGKSDGDRGWVRLDWQIDDLLNAVTYLKTRNDIDSGRIGAFGIGATGGGNAIIAAAHDESIKCVVTQTVIADGADWLRRMRTESEWVEYRRRIAGDNARWVLEGTGEVVHPREDLMVEPAERKIHNPRPTIDAAVGDRYFLKNADSTMRYRPLDVVDRIAPRALMLACVKDDVFTPEDHAIALFERAGEPKKLVRQVDTTHWESYSKNYELLMSETVDWFDRHLVHTPVEVIDGAGAGAPVRDSGRARAGG